MAKKAPSQSLMDALGVTTSVGEGWLGFRLSALARRVKSEGIAWFLLAIFCLCLGAALLRMGLREILAYDTEVFRNVVSSLKALQEPRSEETLPGVLGTVLAPVNAPKEGQENNETHGVEVCADDETLAIINLTFDSFERLVKASQRPDDRWTDVASRLREDFENTSSSHSLPVAAHRKAQEPFSWPAWSIWASDVERDLKAASHRVSPQLRKCPRGHASLGHMTDFGPMWCEQDNHFSIVVPSLFGHCVEPGAAHPPIAPKAPGKSQAVMQQGTCSRVREASNLARLLHDSLRPIMWRFHDNASWTSSRLVQIYYISPDSVLGIWRSTEGKPEDLFPPTRLWGAAHYVQVYLPMKYPKQLPVTPAYIDFAGNGVVQTVCRPLLAGVNGETSTFAAGGRFLGVVCADFTVPDWYLLLELAHSRLVSVERMAIYSSAQANESHFIDVWRVNQDKAAALGGADRRTLENHGEELWTPDNGERRDEIEEAFRESFGGTALEQSGEAQEVEIGRAVSTLTVEGRDSFIVPLGKTDGGNQRALLLTPRRLHAPLGGVLCLVSAVGIGLLAFAFMGKASIRRAEIGNIDARVALLKSLQVGVVLVSADDWIEEANDQAEIVLGVLLTRGVEQGGLGEARTRFSSLIEDEIIALDPDGKPGPNTLSYRMTIPLYREKGISSSYWARLKQGARKGTWIRVLASPIMMGGAAESDNKPRTFGIVEELEGFEKDWLIAQLGADRSGQEGER